MRYLGGKARIAKPLAAVINQYRKGLPVWEPFCGSLAMTLALGGPVIASDKHAALIAMYRAIAAGWDPPTALTREEWRAARLLPDSDPLKAFAGFGCSYNGKYFAGYDGAERTYTSPAGPREGKRTTTRPAPAARRALLRDVPALIARGCEFQCVDFFAIAPCDGFCLYLDPPYRGVTGYSEAFDHERFCARAQEWARFGPVLVSEYDLPIGRCVWEMERRRQIDRGVSRTVEKLYVIDPPSTTRPPPPEAMNGAADQWGGSDYP